MKNKLWLIQLPLALVFSICLYITDQGFRGQLSNAFLRRTVFPGLSRASNTFTNMKFSLRGTQPLKNKIVVIEIDNPAITALGRWPWHRDLSAYLIEKTLQAGAKVIGLDIVFSEPDPRVPAELAKFMGKNSMGGMIPKFETDLVLEDVIRRYPDRLVLGWTGGECQPLFEQTKDCPVAEPDSMKLFPPDFDKFSFSNFTSPSPFNPTRTTISSFVEPIVSISSYHSVAKHAGYFNAVLDPDGYIRRSNLLGYANGKALPSLPLEMARIGLKERLQVTLDKDQRVQTVGFVNSKKNIPVTPTGAILINFRGPNGGEYPHISAMDVLDEDGIIKDAENKNVGKSIKEIMKDAYVFVGITAVGVYDMRQYPLEDGPQAGVYGHVNILDNILSQDPLLGGATGTGTFWLYLLMIGGVTLFAFAIERLGAIPSLGLFLLIFFGVLLIDVKILFSHSINLNSVFLLLELCTVFFLIMAAKYVLEEKSKKFIRGAFSKYVPPSVVDQILLDPTKLSLGGEKRELTIMFSDIRSFTTFSEKMDAKALASFLNDYLSIMTGIVFANNGTLDKYIGDAVMAFWVPHSLSINTRLTLARPLLK